MDLNRLFADKEEPVGDRVNSYFILTALKFVLKALQPDELDVIRPAFGRLLDVYSKPSFSGKLCNFLLTRQLDVIKRHEIWVVFGGKPIRFPLREFGIVTGLNCSPIPVLDPKLVKATPGVAPYWFTLFGGEENVTSKTLSRDLKKASSLSRERRIKYACLLLVHGLLCRRSFNIKIPKEHVELIRDLPNFLNFPWGRYAFQLTMQSIKSRTVNQLAQSTVAIQGFIHALQLVVLAAVPAPACAVGDGTDPESGDEGNPSLCSLKLDKLWEVEEDENVEVMPIIPSICATDEAVDLTWPDEVRDYNVEHLELLIRQGTQFSRSMFTGGRRGYAVTMSDVVIVKSKRKRRREIKSSPQGKSKSSQNGNSKDAPAQSNVSKVSNKRRRPKVVSERKCDKGNETNSSGYVDLKALIQESQAELYAHLKCDMKDMEARFESNIKNSVPIYVGEWLMAKSVLQSSLLLNTLPTNSSSPSNSTLSIVFSTPVYNLRLIRN